MNVPDLRVALLLVLFFFGFGGCEKQDPTAVHKLHWDRDMCERCKMVVSERHHAVQVIDPKGHAHMFDDIGCTVLWLDEEKIPWAERAKIWITDADSGKWIDARTAFYDAYNITPMAYGLGAHEKRADIKPGVEVLDFDAMVEKVNKIEARNLKKGH